MAARFLSCRRVWTCDSGYLSGTYVGDLLAFCAGAGTLGLHGGRFCGSCRESLRLLSRHRPASLLITVASLLLMADAVRRVLSDDAYFNVLTWIALALMAYALFALWYVQRRALEDVRLVMAWGILRLSRRRPAWPPR